MTPFHDVRLSVDFDPQVAKRTAEKKKEMLSPSDLWRLQDKFWILAIGRYSRFMISLGTDCVPLITP